MSSYITQSSVMTVSGDLVTERSVGSKVIYSISYIAYLVTSFMVFFAYSAAFFSNLTEFYATLSVLLCAWISTSIANLVLYKTIRPRGRPTSSENAPGSDITAGICLRLLFTMLPFSPILRYIESYRANNELLRLENKLRDSSSKLNRAGEEKIVRAIQRARRECRRRDKAAGLLALFSAVTGAGPMAILQLFFFGMRAAKRLPNFQPAEASCIFASVICGGIWIATALVHFYPSLRNSTVPAQQSTSLGSRVCGFILLFCWHLFMVAARLIVFALFGAEFGFFLIPVLPVHIGFCMALLYVSRCVGDDSKSCSIHDFLRDLFHGLVGVYDFINANQRHTRLRYLIFYGVVILENGGLIGAWYSRRREDEGLARLLVVLAVAGSNLLGFLAMQFYYLFFFPETSNPGLCGLCSDQSATEERHNRDSDSRSMEEIDPTVRYRYDSSERWVAQQNFADAASVHTDRVPPSDGISYSQRPPSSVGWEVGSHGPPAVIHETKNRPQERPTSYRDPRFPRGSRPPSSYDAESNRGHPPSNSHHRSREMLERDPRFPRSSRPPSSVDAESNRGHLVSHPQSRSREMLASDSRPAEYRDPPHPRSSRPPSSHDAYSNQGLPPSHPQSRSREMLASDPRAPEMRDPRYPRGSHPSSLHDADSRRSHPGSRTQSRSREMLASDSRPDDPRYPRDNRPPSSADAHSQSRSREMLASDPRSDYRDPRYPSQKRAEVADAPRNVPQARGPPVQDPRFPQENRGRPAVTSRPQSSTSKPSARSQPAPVAPSAAAAEEDDESSDSFSPASSSSSSLSGERQKRV